MFRSALEPDIFDEAEAYDADADAEVNEYICSKETFASIGGMSATLIDNAAIAASIAPDTESPIEVLFGAEAVKYFVEKFKNHSTMKFASCRQADENIFVGDHTLLMPQYRWRNYRIDLVVKITFLNQPYFFIECDGKDFHSSEQQILRDHAKDQAITNAGIQIFRFSGSELERNPRACIEVVHSVAKAQYEREWNAGFHRQTAA
jgi:very-short-patch-repair endonuclease